MTQELNKLGERATLALNLAVGSGPEAVKELVQILNEFILPRLTKIHAGIADNQKQRINEAPHISAVTSTRE